MTPDLIRNVSVGADAPTGDKIYLTFDLDWCSDEVLVDTLDMLEEHGVPATFFVTHETPLLDRIRANPMNELGIHPNFNFLLEGDFRYGRTFREVIEHFLRIVPDAVSVRSHSLVQSSKILDAFSDCGLTHDCNLFFPLEFRPRAFMHWSGNLVRVPYIFEDDVECLGGWRNKETFEELENLDCIKVLNWHPIHLFLNTEHLDRYVGSGEVHRVHDSLKNHVNRTSFGARDFLLHILKRCV